MQINAAIRYLLEWPKSRTLTPPNCGEGVEQQELSFPLGGDGNGRHHQFLTETEYALTTSSSNPASWY
jgi:hypothetical protein